MRVEYEHKFRSGEYRPCIVKATNEKALFHRWVENCSMPGMVFALVELEDGRMLTVNPKNIRFLDSPGIFSDICWNMGDKEERENEELKKFVHENI